MLFADESVIQLMANVVHTYAPKGQTPVLKQTKPARSQKVYAISAISAQGDLFYQTRDTRFKTNGIIHFLKYIVRQIRRKIILVWDGAGIHFSKGIKEYLATLRSNKLTLVRLPAHSPELNPDEQVWAYLKCQSDLRNFAAKNFTELRQVVRTQLQQLKNDPDRIKKMFAHPKCGFY